MNSKIDLGGSCLSLLPACENVDYDIGSCDSEDEDQGGEKQKNRFEMCGVQAGEGTMGGYAEYTFLFLLSLNARGQTLVNFCRVF